MNERRIAKRASAWAAAVLLAAGMGMAAETHSISDGVLTFDVPEGTVETYASKLSAGGVTSIVKKGLGTVLVDQSNDDYSGPIDVQAGVLQVGTNTLYTSLANALGQNNVVTVADGASVLVSLRGIDQGHNTVFPTTTFRIRGRGFNEQGVLNAQHNGMADSLWANVVMEGDAMINSGGHRSGIKTRLDMGGHTLVVTNRGEFMVNNGPTIVNPGRIDYLGGQDITFQGSNGMADSGSAENEIRVLPGASGPALQFWDMSVRPVWTVRIGKTTNWRIGAGDFNGNWNKTGRNNWAGPIEIADGCNLMVEGYTGNNPNRVLLTRFDSKISGKGGFILRQTPGYDTPALVHAVLANPANDYEGETLVFSEQSFRERPRPTLWALVPGSIPTAGGMRVHNHATVNLVMDNAAGGGWTLEKAHEFLEAIGPDGISGGRGGGHLNLFTGGDLVDSTDFTKDVYYGHAGTGTLVFSGDLPKSGGTHFLNDGGEMVLTGNKDRNLASIMVTEGTLTLENTGRLFAMTNETRSPLTRYWHVGGTSTNPSAPARLVCKSGTFIDSEPRFTTSGAAAAFSIGSSGTRDAVMEVHDGAVITNGVNVGSEEYLSGAYYQYGGTVYSTVRNSNDGYAGKGYDAYGYMGLFGGRFTMRAWMRLGESHGSAGVVEVKTNAVLELTDNSFVVAGGGVGELHVNGGRVEYTGNKANDSARILMGECQWSGAKKAERATATVQSGELDLSGWLALAQFTNAFTGVVNMNGGRLTATHFSKHTQFADQRQPASKAFVNFNGGTFRAYATTDVPFGADALKCDRVTVFEKGGTIDLNGKTVTVKDVPISAPAGRGVASIEIPADRRTGFIGAPEVTIAGDGEGATAHCEFDPATGTVGPVVVTSPGWGYTTATATIKTTGRGTPAQKARGVISCAVTLTDGDQKGGGLVVADSSATPGALDLACANDYAGATVVSNGTLRLSVADALPAANEIHLAGGTLETAAETSIARFGGFGTLAGTASLTVTDALVFDPAEHADGTRALSAGDNLVLGDDVAVEIANTNALVRGVSYVLVNSSTPLPARLAAASNLSAPWTLYRTSDGRTLKMHYQEGTLLMLR